MAERSDVVLPNLAADNHRMRIMKLQLSESRGKVLSLMETKTETETTSETNAASVPRFVELQSLVASMAADFQKFYQGGNKASGTRVRIAMQELKTLAQSIRTEVQAIKNEGKPASTAEIDSEAS